MSLAHRGSKHFYYEMEQLLIDSELPLDASHIKRALQAYARVDMGSGIFYKNMIDHMSSRLRDDFSLMEKVAIAATIANCTNVHAGCYGLMGMLEQEIKQEIQHKRLYFHDASRIAIAFFPHNLGSNGIQEMIEDRIYCTWDLTDPKHGQEILRIVKKTSGYYFRSEPLLTQIQKLIGETLARDQVRRSQIEELFWAVSKERGSCFSRNLKYQILARMDKFLPSFKIRTLAFMAQGTANIYKDEVDQIPTQYSEKPDMHLVMVNTQFKEIVKKLEEMVHLKQHQLKNPHDSVKLLMNFVRMSKAYVSSEAFELLVGSILKEPKSVKYADALTFFEMMLYKLPYISQRNLSGELWREFEKEVFSPVLKKMPPSDIARLLEIVRIIGFTSQDFISELVAIIQHKAYDFNHKDFATVAAGLLEIGGIEEFKRAITPIITDLLYSQTGFELISTQKNYDKKSRISFKSEDIDAKQRAMLNILWSVFVLRKIDPSSTVAKKLYIAVNLDLFQESFQNILIDQLTFEEYLKLSQIVQINEQLSSGRRSRSKSRGSSTFSINWLKEKRKEVAEDVIARWLDQDRLTPSSQALKILSSEVQKEMDGKENIQVQEKVLDFFGNQFHQLIGSEHGLTAINIVPRRIYIGEESKRRPVSETVRGELIKEQGIELREIQEQKAIARDRELEQIVKMK